MTTSGKGRGGCGLVIVLLFAALLTLVATVQTANSVRAMAWPSAAGTVTRTWVDDTRSGRSSRRTFTPHVAYTYRVNGQTYSGERLTFSRLGSSDYGEQQRVTARYPVGRAVPVHYQPSNPANSVLRVGLSQIPWLTWALAALFVTLSVWLFRLTRRR